MLKKLFKRDNSKKTDSRTSKTSSGNPKAANAAAKTSVRGSKGKVAPTRNTNNAKPAHGKAAAKSTAPKSESKVDVKPWKLEEFKVEPAEGKTRFHDLMLPESVMRGIHELGFEYCSPIQAESLPAALRGRDTIGQAQTGTGKTAAFLLTIFNRILNVVPEERFASEPRALVVAPTRELALQIGKDAEGLAKYTGLNVVTVVGGMNYESQRQMLRDNVVDVLVATPGRLIDFMRSQDV